MSAVFSDCGQYRYELRRSWLTGEGTCCFIMLNPSTAGATEDDPTIRKCMGYAARWGYRDLVVVNLFGIRSTDPKNLPAYDDPVGPDNDAFIIDAIHSSALVVCAWGNDGAILERGPTIAAWASRFTSLFCLGANQSGEPKHPLYLKGDLEPVLWRERH